MAYGEGVAERLRELFASHRDVAEKQMFGCLPLAARDIRVPKKGQALKATLIMAFAVVATAFGLLPVAGALAFVALGGGAAALDLHHGGLAGHFVARQRCCRSRTPWPPPVRPT